MDLLHNFGERRMLLIKALGLFFIEILFYRNAFIFVSSFYLHVEITVLTLLGSLSLIYRLRSSASCLLGLFFSRKLQPLLWCFFVLILGHHCFFRRFQLKGIIFPMILFRITILRIIIRLSCLTKFFQLNNKLMLIVRF